MTVFHKTRTALTVWFEVAWLVTASKSGGSASPSHRVLPICSHQTAWTMPGKLRQVMTSAQSEPFSGRVEVNETFFGGPQPDDRGSGAAGKTLMVGAVEIAAPGWGRARLAVIPDASAQTLKTFVAHSIAAGPTVVTDAWSSYPPALEGYTHTPLNVSASGRPAQESLPAVHRLFALVKRALEGAYQGAGSSEHLPEHLDELMFRFNRRHSRHRGLVFLRLLQRAVAGDPVTYRDLGSVPRAKAVRPPDLTSPSMSVRERRA